MLYGIGVSVALFIFWYLLSGMNDTFLLAAGAGSAIFVTLFVLRMEMPDRGLQPFHLTLRAITYWPWLIKEIAKAAWDVARIIVNPALPISPTMVRFRPTQKTVFGLVTHANSITLTPGTITVQEQGGEFVVHGLTRDGALATIDSEMNARVKRFEGSA